jgi:hypothetical protein
MTDLTDDMYPVAGQRLTELTASTPWGFVSDVGDVGDANATDSASQRRHKVADTDARSTLVAGDLHTSATSNSLSSGETADRQLIDTAMLKHAGGCASPCLSSPPIS